MQNIEQNQKLSITWVKQPGNPPPITNKYVWVKRRVYVVKPVTASTTTGLFTGDISSALTGVSGDFSVRKVNAWFAPTTGVSVGATFTVKTKDLIDATGTLPDAIVNDFGTGTSLAGVAFKAPLTRVKNYEYDTAGATNLMSVDSGVAGNLICHVTVMQCISA